MPAFQAHQEGGYATWRGGPPRTDDPIYEAPKELLALKPDVDPAPKPWPFVPALAVLFVLSFLSLQFILPVTHVRHPADPRRVWYPVNSEMEPVLEELQLKAEEPRGTLILIRTEESDLRSVSVVINSTIVHARLPQNLHFCVIVPSTLSKTHISKLKVVFSNRQINILSDSFVLEKMKPFVTAEDSKMETLRLLPFYLPEMFPEFGAFIFLDADSVVQVAIEELFELDMKDNAIAAVEDCSQIFETSFSVELLEAARSSEEVGKPWMPPQSYEPRTCLFDRGVLVLNQQNWIQRNMTQAVRWWTSLHLKTDKSLFSVGHPELAVHLALYQNYTKLDGSWSVREPLTFQKANTANLFHFDNKQVKPWHHARPAGFHKDVAGLWWKYLSQPVNEILGS